MKQAAEDVRAVLPWRHGAGPSAVVSAAPAPQALEELLLRAAPCAVHHRVPLHIIQQIFLFWVGSLILFTIHQCSDVVFPRKAIHSLRNH